MLSNSSTAVATEQWCSVGHTHTHKSNKINQLCVSDGNNLPSC